MLFHFPGQWDDFQRVPKSTQRWTERGLEASNVCIVRSLFFPETEILIFFPDTEILYFSWPGNLDHFFFRDTWDPDFSRPGNWDPVFLWYTEILVYCIPSFLFSVLCIPISSLFVYPYTLLISILRLCIFEETCLLHPYIQYMIWTLIIYLLFCSQRENN